MRIVCSLFLVMVLVMVIAAMGGCSISASSGSISDSISSPSKSASNSSKSSSGGDEEASEPEEPQDKASYEDDVSQLAVTYAKLGGEIGAFRMAVSELAMNRGITNWEVDSTTCQAIGRGVGTAGMQEQSFTNFSKQLFGDDLKKQSDLRMGYQQTAPSATRAPSQDSSRG